jgi:hypothetical protein
MSGLHTLDKSRKGSAVAAYLERCDLLLERAFQEKVDTRRAFRAWMEPKLNAEGDAAMALLHAEPLYVVAQYLGVPALAISPEVIKRATKLAREQHW